MTDVGFIGDDLNDIEILKHVRWVGVRFSAQELVGRLANVLLRKKGGEGSLERSLKLF